MKSLLVDKEVSFSLAHTKKRLEKDITIGTILWAVVSLLKLVSMNKVCAAINIFGEHRCYIMQSYLINAQHSFISLIHHPFLRTILAPALTYQAPL